MEKKRRAAAAQRPAKSLRVAGRSKNSAINDCSLSSTSTSSLLSSLSSLLPTSKPLQPKQIHEIKDFLLTARRKDARAVRVKKAANGATKFKVRCSRHLYTLVVADAEKAGKLRQSLPPGLDVLDNL